ncbi:hypothetical protein [Enterobacter bugandensis]|uniref:hypothetical protein n=1 Tax=Enterobacter bugandensis TaxID=881260 RepID=UPI0022E462CF
MAVRNNILIITTLFFILPISCECFANDYFYRVDRRDPVEIFKNGFRPAGTLRDVLRHVEGDVCYTPGASPSEQSAFISATIDSNVAISIGGNWRAGTVFYIYSIRPSSRFYSAYASLDYAFRNSQRSIFESARDAMAADYEWLALDGISISEIYSAQTYTSNGDGTALAGETTLNSAYDSIGDFQPNRSPFEEYSLDDSSSERSCLECFSSGPESPLRLMSGVETEAKKRWCKLSDAISMQGVIHTWSTEL